MLLRATALFTLLFSAAVLTGAERGFILQAPRVFVRNTNIKVYLKLFDVQHPGKVTVKLLKEAGDVPYYNNTVDIRKDDAGKPIALDVTVPGHADKAVRLHVSGEFDTPDKYKFSGEDIVDISKGHPSHIFIQTEKHIYQAGDTVKFRVMCLDRKLKPVANANVTVTVKTPLGSEVGKWTHISMKKGFQQFELPLANKPPFGTWFISATVLDMKEEIHFQVNDNAKMKFEVNINPPSFVLQDTETISVQICAQYSYGKLVKGKLTLTGCVGTASLKYEPFQTLVDEKEITGCGNYTFQMSTVDREYQHHSGDLKLIAEVIEDKTGAKVEATKVISRSPNAVHLEFKSHTEYFKPGLPYHGTIRVTYPDNTPAEEQYITVCMKMYHECSSKPKSKLCRNFTSDATGVVRFTIPPQDTEAVSILIEAMSSVYGTVPSAPKEVVHVDRISKRLRPWYSKTKSYIQVDNIQTNLHCNTKKKFQILYIGEEKKDFQGYYEVINRGRLVEKGAIDLSYKGTDISAAWKDTVLHTEITDSGIVRNETFLKNTTLLQIASASIELDITAVNFPVSHLLVYSFGASREIIADSFKFAVEECLSKDIKVKFHESVNKGIQISVTAPPHSLCGIQAIDKDDSKLQHKLRFEKETILQKIFNHEFGLFHPKTHCKGSSTHYYGDSISAFELSGFLVISDYKLITRPCETNTAALGNCNFGDASDNAHNNGSGKDQLIDASDTVDETIASFSKTWLFDTVQVGESGSSVMDYALPNSSNGWLGNIVCTNTLGGIGFSKVHFVEESSLYHMQITVPFMVVIGEKFPISLSLFTVSKKCIPLYVELHKSSGFELVVESSKTGICVCDGNEEDYEFFVKAKKMGKWAVAVTATAAAGTIVCDKREVITSIKPKTVEDTVNVKAEGYPYTESTCQMICLKENDGVHKMNRSFSKPHDVINDSTVVYHSISSNIISVMVQDMKTFFALYPSWGDWILMQMSALMFSLDYLSSTGTLTDELKAEGVAILQKGYQLALTFRWKDYSYMAVHGKKIDMYLTAHVVRAFTRASRYIHIHPDDISKTRDWLLSVQEKDGCFDKATYHYYGKYEVTAYTITSFIIYGMSPDHPAIKRALSCLESNKRPTVGEMAFYAYTYAMVGDQAKAEYYLNELTAYAIIEDNMMHWHGYLELDGYYGLHDVGITAKVVITMMKLGKPPNYCIPIIRWLNANAPSKMDYIFSDAVLAVEAFSKFAPYISYDDISVQVNVTGALNKTFHVKKEDGHFAKEDKLPTTTNLSHTLSGYGCVVINTTIQYNTKTFPKKDFFDLSASTTHTSCKTATIQIRTKSIAERNKTLGMAVVKVAMISGYDPDEESIKKLVENKELGVKRYKIKEGVVILFFDKFQTNLKVFDIQVKRSLVIKDAKPAAIKVYDYYSPGQDQQILYSIDGCM